MNTFNVEKERKKETANKRQRMARLKIIRVDGVNRYELGGGAKYEMCKMLGMWIAVELPSMELFSRRR